MSNYDPDNEVLYSLLDKAIDTAMIDQKFLFNMKRYLVDHSYTRNQTKEQCKEAYGHLKKIQVVKIRNYLAKITTEVHEHYAQRKPGRPKGSKNKKKRTK